MPKWVEDFQRVNVNANHWAILSQPEVIAKEIKMFVQNWRCVEAS
jgi:thioesterase domain-containing protein